MPDFSRFVEMLWFLISPKMTQHGHFGHFCAFYFFLCNRQNLTKITKIIKNCKNLEKNSEIALESAISPFELILPYFTYKLTPYTRVSITKNVN